MSGDRGTRVDERSDRFTIRAMGPADVDLRIDYFHDASDGHLALLGVGRALLPPRVEWRRAYEKDFARPLPEREHYGVLWLVDQDVVGLSTVDRISFGDEAFMHLHLLHREDRHRGLGTQFVALSVRHYAEVLQLRRVYCQPNAYNTAPNRTLQKAGFRYRCTVHCAPSAINTPQPVTRWLWEPEPGQR